jgi:hypothetical protein
MREKTIGGKEVPHNADRRPFSRFSRPLEIAAGPLETVLSAMLLRGGDPWAL